MQYCFSASQNPYIQNNILRKIEEYKNKKRPIILVSYMGGYSRNKARTIKKIYDALKGYRFFYQVMKDEDDGSLWVIECLEKNRISPSFIEICGVNLDCCVSETATGLAGVYEDIKIHILKDCSWSDTCHGISDAIKEVQSAISSYKNKLFKLV